MTTTAARRAPAAATAPVARALVPGLSTRPDVVILDLATAVLARTPAPDGPRQVARLVGAELARAGQSIPESELEQVLADGLAALAGWTNAQARRLAPEELDPRTVWTDFLASPLPRAAREVLAGSAGTLLARMATLLMTDVPHPGLPDLLDAARELDVRVGVVADTHSGRALRTLLAAHGLGGAFGVQVYSDEVGIRLPHPGIVELAVRALGTVPARAWFVGGSPDLDVVVGRRAGVGSVVLVDQEPDRATAHGPGLAPDAVVDGPEAVASLLRAALPAPPRSARPVRVTPSDPAPLRVPHPPSALLLDHEGVIATTAPDAAGVRRFAADLAARLGAAGHDVDVDAVLAAISRARTLHDAQDSPAGPGASSSPAPDARPAADVATFWADLVGRELGALGPGVQDWLRAEAHDLMTSYVRASVRTEVRPGVRAVLQHARDARIPVAVVANTLNGRAVREALEGVGLDRLVGAHAYSDELRRRKPDPALVVAALAALDADPATAWFVGDTPHRDVPAARGAGVGNVVLVRGGASDDMTLGAARGAHSPDYVITEVSDLLDLWPTIG